MKPQHAPLPLIVLAGTAVLVPATAQAQDATSFTVASQPTTTDSAAAPAAEVASFTVGAAPTAQPTAQLTAQPTDPPGFTIGARSAAATIAAPAPAPKTPAPAADQATKPDLFAGGSDSLVARTVGHAEGTRGADGGKNRAYYGHSDPGNGVWNLGSFSYQHGAATPNEADVKQLRRLQAQADELQRQAAVNKITMTLEEELNGIDLANQSPAAALNTPAYVDWLKKAHAKGLTGQDAILDARVMSYWDVGRGRWAAPGLGNTEAGIRHDQERRMLAIAKAYEWYQRDLGQGQVVAKAAPSVAPAPTPVTTKPVSKAEATAAAIIFQDLRT